VDEETKVLFVDDEQNVLNAIKRVFLDEKCVILSATSGAEGLKILSKHRVQVVVSDYRMPGMNGIEFLKEVRMQWPETIRIVLSGYADIASIIEAVNEGRIYKFVPKPWNDNELKVTISRAIERYYLHKKNMELALELSKKNDELTRLNKELEVYLTEKSENLEFRSKLVTAYQNILDAIPAGIIGIDSNNVLALCNTTWTEINGKSRFVLDQEIEGHVSEETDQFIEEVSTKGSLKKRTSINGIKGILSGVVMKDGNGQEGIILVFMREDDLT
jgi:two-component system NtrC family sensor kinase